MLAFDETTARLLDDAYQGADVTRRRRASFDALDPRAGDRVLDLGCGNGLLTLDLARRVGDGGHVFGIDPSPDMLAVARSRCGARSNVTLIEGRADRLPLDAAGIDRAVSLQVFEYFDDMAPALTELRRVLRPGGRLVISDMHWDTLVWHSGDAARMRRLLTAWDAHLAERRAPELLPGALIRAGFVPHRMTPVTVCATRLHPDGLPQMMIRLITRFAAENRLADPDEAADWAAEQMELDSAGRFFFSLTHFVCTAQAP